MNTCETCRFFQPPDKRFDQTGECRRYPRFEERYPSDWCGEHKEIVNAGD